jgi:hypothetical protein
VELSKTEQYKKLAILEQLDLYDIVTCKISQLDINLKARVIKYKYNCLKNRYDSIELGEFKAISKYQTNNIIQQIQERFRAAKSSIDRATNVITGNKGGYVVLRRYPNGKPYEILIMDTEDINTARNVLRINNNGIGFSESGYNGPYGTAMTIDGHIVADYVDTGILTSVQIKSSDDTISIDLANGTFVLRDSNGQALITPNGVANSDNFSMTDNIQDGFPLIMPFNIDGSTSSITSALLKYTQQSFRTYSDVASSGGGTTKTTTTNPTSIVTSFFDNPASTNSAGGMTTNTGSTSAFEGESHNHSYSTPEHSHYFSYGHAHGIEDNGHNHEISIDPHSHDLNFGIKEQAISDYTFTVYVDGNAVVSVINNIENIQGIIDLTAYITTTGWHTIEIRSTTLKRVSAQVSIKSYIRR